MNDDQYEVLLGKLDGVARAFMLFVMGQEQRGKLDGVAYCRDLRLVAAARDQHPQLVVSAGVMREIAGELEQARLTRSAVHRCACHETEHR